MEQCWKLVQLLKIEQRNEFCISLREGLNSIFPEFYEGLMK
jgi:hypothetical protein